MRTKDEIQKIITDAVSWFHIGGVFFAMRWNTANEPVSKQELDLVDPRLTRILSQHIGHSDRPTPNSLFAGNLLTTSQKLWAHTLWKIEDSTGSQHYVVDILSFVEEEVSPAIAIRADAVRIDFLEHLPGTEDRYIKYGSHIFNMTIILATAWFDEQYPNWQQRYATGKGLDFSEPELIQYVFSNPEKESDRDLPNCDFT